MTNQTFKVNDPQDKKMLKKVFWRTMTLSSTYNYERMQALGYLYTMIPVIDRYNEKKEDRIEGYKRHYELFNTTPTMGGFITGLSTSMEKEAAEDQNFDKSSINAVKLSLMGPFAGIGDSIFQGSLRIISLGIGVALAAQGSILGVILHLLLYNVLAHLLRYYGVFAGYNMGTSFLKSASENGVLGKLTKGAGIVGLMTVGAMTCSMVSFNIPAVAKIQGSELVVQDMLDQIFPNMLPLLLTFVCYKLLKKNVKPIWIMLGMMVVGVLGKVIGIF